MNPSRIGVKLVPPMAAEPVEQAAHDVVELIVIRTPPTRRRCQTQSSPGS
jgi:hypothetical protein